MRVLKAFKLPSHIHFSSLQANTTTVFALKVVVCFLLSAVAAEQLRGSVRQVNSDAARDLLAPQSCTEPPNGGCMNDSKCR
jgi:hypothetical protein